MRHKKQSKSLELMEPIRPNKVMLQNAHQNKWLQIISNLALREKLTAYTLNILPKIEYFWFFFGQNRMLLSFKKSHMRGNVYHYF